MQRARSRRWSGLPVTHAAVTSLALTGLVIPGCSCESPQIVDASDSGRPVDAGRHDAGPDTDGARADSGRRDAGPQDSGGTGLPDASSSVCAAPPPSTYDPLLDWTPPALAASVTVTSASDSGAGSLREAIDSVAAGGVIGFAPALAGQTIALESTLTLARAATIDGSAAPGLTIDAQQNGSAFRYNSDSPGRVAFFSLRIVNGRTEGSGGAISINGGNLEIEVGGCYFENNAAHEGGAIRVGYAHDTTAYIHDSTFADNDGSLENSMGQRSGFSGGAISATGTDLRVSRCRFERNVGNTVGGVYTIHSDPIIEDSVFIENRAFGNGGSGGFFADGAGPTDDNSPVPEPGDLRILRSRFERNRGAGADGGGIMIWGYPLDVFTIEDSIFLENTCDSGGKGGGAKIHSRAPLYVRRTAFVGNVSDGQGGGIWVDGEGPFTLENVLFTQNRADGDRGGGCTFNVAEGARVDLNHVTWVENSALNGCGAFWTNRENNELHIRSSIVANNTGANAWEVQIGYAPAHDEGGNLEWPAPTGGSRRVSPSGMVADPMLGALTEENGTYVRLLLAGSPAIDSAAIPGPTTDARGAPRDDMPDIGAHEHGASCGM